MKEAQWFADQKKERSLAVAYGVHHSMHDAFMAMFLLQSQFQRFVFEIEPKHPVTYVMLSKIYTNAGLWQGVKMVREMMEKCSVKKEVGCSWIQIKNRLHTFG